MLQNEELGRLITEYLHYGWRKFWKMMIWNGPEWMIRTVYFRIFSLWLPIKFCCRIKQLVGWNLNEYFHHGGRKFWKNCGLKLSSSFLRDKGPAVHSTGRKINIFFCWILDQRWRKRKNFLYHFDFHHNPLNQYRYGKKALVAE